MTEAAGSTDWPSEIRLRSGGAVLAVAFDTASYDLPAEYLRVMSPSAEVQGHSAAERKTIGGKQAVRITQVLPVGSYAVRLVFDDGHDTGIFTWSYLAELGRDYSPRWTAHLAELKAKGLAR